MAKVKGQQAKNGDIVRAVMSFPVHQLQDIKSLPTVSSIATVQGEQQESDNSRRQDIGEY